jgi:Carboxypeptidase regulatory-like domain
MEAKAEHEGGWSCTQLVWLDSVQDLCGTDDVTVEIEWSAEANVGSVAIELTDGKEPADPEDSKSICLLRLSGEKFAPLFSRHQRTWIDICGLTKTATVYTPDGIPRGAAAIDLRKLSVWKLRFLVGAGSSASLPPSRSAVQIHRVCAKRLPSRASVSGRVIDEIANRGIPGSVVHFGNDKVVTNSDGTFSLRTTPGKQRLHADATGYQEIAAPVVSVEPGRRTLADVRMKRTQFGYGHVVASIPLSQFVQSVAISREYVYFTAARGHGPQVLFQVPITSGREVELGTISISPSQKNLPAALTAGSPNLFSVGSGMTWTKGVIYGVSGWPGRIFRVATNGELTLVHRLAIDWPQGIVFDGKRFWFLENSALDNRYGLYAIDSQTGRTVISVPSSDKKISGLAWGLGRLWVSSLAGHVYEIDIDQAIEKKSLEAGAVNRFAGEYRCLGFGDDHLWGLDPEAKRLCQIKVQADQ